MYPCRWVYPTYSSPGSRGGTRLQDHTGYDGHLEFRPPNCGWGCGCTMVVSIQGLFGEPFDVHVVRKGIARFYSRLLEFLT